MPSKHDIEGVQTTLAQALAQVIHDDPVAPRSLVPSLPVDLETIALQCLAKDPAQRYPSARALADGLCRNLEAHSRRCYEQCAGITDEGCIETPNLPPPKFDRLRGIA